MRVLLSHTELFVVHFGDRLHQLQQSIRPVRWILRVQYRLLRLDCHNVRCLRCQYDWLYIVHYCQQLFDLRYSRSLRCLRNELYLRAGLLPAGDYLHCLHGRMRPLLNFHDLHHLQRRRPLCF